MLLERFGFRAMGSPCQIQLWGESRSTLEPVFRRCAEEIQRLEHKFSRYRADSLASRIKASAGDPNGIEVDDETALLLDFAATAHTESGGRFDPTSGVLRRIWDFKSNRLPSSDEIALVLPLVGWQEIVWERPRLVLPRTGMELDFGGFVKEYAADRVAELCRSLGVHAGLVDLGGDLAVVGPHPGGDPWLIGIRDPRSPERAIARVAVSQGGLATSGDYERFIIVDGERYPHIMDPRTGQSFRDGPACVSVVAPLCLLAGVTSTIAMLHEENEAGPFLAELGLSHLTIDQAGRIRGDAVVLEPSAAA